MLTGLVTILLFGFMGYSMVPDKKPAVPNRLDIVLVVLLIVAANLHGLGFSGIGELRMYHNDMLQGIIAGILIRRMTGKVTSPA